MPIALLWGAQIYRVPIVSLLWGGWAPWGAHRPTMRWLDPVGCPSSHHGVAGPRGVPVVPL